MFYKVKLMIFQSERSAKPNLHIKRTIDRSERCLHFNAPIYAQTRWSGQCNLAKAGAIFIPKRHTREEALGMFYVSIAESFGAWFHLPSRTPYSVVHFWPDFGRKVGWTRISRRHHLAQAVANNTSDETLFTRRLRTHFRCRFQVAYSWHRGR